MDLEARRADVSTAWHGRPDWRVRLAPRITIKRLQTEDPEGDGRMMADSP
jgi:hypothetical protein